MHNALVLASRLTAQDATFAAFLLMQFIASRYPKYYNLIFLGVHTAK